MRRTAGVVFAGLLFSAVAPAIERAQADEDALARSLVQVAGVNHGLAFHIGCGRVATPGLTAALAEQGLVVHSLALDAAAAQRARKAIAAKGMAGRAMVECVPAKPLPYLDNLADLVVVEDTSAMASAGVSRQELLRVVAPGGALCVLEGGKWTKTVKPRPKEMDEWTHPFHGPDAKMVSADKVVRFPIGLRWIDGLPMNLVRWAGVRGWVVANGRCFSLSSTELENIGRAVKPHYLVARDAWNGLPLWKINCETTDDGSYLTWVNAGPLATDGERVYATKKDKLIAVEAATGRILYTCPNKFPPCRILVTDGVLICSCWQERDFSRAAWDSFRKAKDPKKARPSLWSTWIARGGVGTVEAYEAATGSPRWSLPVAAEMTVAADGVLYCLVQKGNPPTERQVVAVDIESGKERWRVASSQFGPEADFQLNVAGPGYVAVVRRKANAILAFSASDGKLLWKMPSGAHWTPVVNGLLWCGNKKLDPLTGQVKGTLAHGVGSQGCTPSAIVNGILTQSRGCGYVLLPADNDPAKGKPKPLRYTGSRGSCMEGMAAANGMFYTSQNNCACAPGQVYGFLAVGPSGPWPSAADFARPRPLDKGPAFGAVEEATVAVEDWPLFLHDPERSAGSAARLPDGLEVAWKTRVASPGEGMVGAAWRSSLASPLSAPTVAYGKVFVARTDAGQVVALDHATGKSLWSFTAGGRIDTPPTLHRGLALFGCHDGYVYALRASDGALAWRTRVAPWERRMVAYGEVESVWPAVGTVVVHDGVAFANAGRTSESDGGVAVVALDPPTGRFVWGRALSPGPLRQNDLLRLREGQLFWHHIPIDPRTGEPDLKARPPKGAKQGGLMDATWTLVNKRRAGNAFACDSVRANLLAWNDALIVSPRGATPRAKEKSAKGWKPALPKGAQVEALGLGANAAVYAGRIKGAPAGEPSGFLVVFSASDGRKLGEFPLPAPPTYEGIAIAGGRLFVSLGDGALLCIGQ